MSDTMHTFPVRAVVTHHPGYRSLLFDRPFDARPGQFVMLWLPGVDEKPFSISWLDQDRLELTIRAVGPFTRALMEVTPGQRLGIRGPFGNGFSLRSDTLAIGGGCGIAPLRFLAQVADERGMGLHLALGVRTAWDLLYPAFFAERPRCWFASEDGSIGRKGQVTDLIPELLASHAIRHVIASGPEAMMVRIHQDLEQSELELELNMERHMKCGIGLCGQCTLDGPGLRLCIEGPVVQRRELQAVTDLCTPHRGPTGARN
jgi:dihydroorotate dehydrogenase electron transfer subunit